MAMRNSTTGRRGAAWLPVALLVLAACGSSGSKAASPNTNAGTSTSTKSAADGSAVVKTSDNAKLGTVLVDAEGRTLYTLTNGGKPVACTGQCAVAWPPLLLPSGVTSAQGAAGVTGLGAVSMNGGMQVTERGDPLYRFAADTTPGDVKGEGIHGFGGVWHVATVSAASSGAGTTGTTPTTAPVSSGGGGGYGY